MPCYECGSEDGTAIQLCKECIDRKKAERQIRKDEFYNMGPRRDVTAELLTNPLMQLFGIVVLAVFLSVVFMYKGPVLKFGTAASIFFGCMITGWIVSLATWGFFWLRLVVHDPIWGFASLLFPGFVYRYAYLYWEEGKKLVVIHLFGFAMIFLFAFPLSLAMKIKYFDAVLIYKLYATGSDVQIWEGGGLRSGEYEIYEEQEY